MSEMTEKMTKAVRIDHQAAAACPNRATASAATNAAWN